MSPHPAPDALRAFATGQLTREECARIETHLDQCAACGELLDEVNLDHDPLLDLLRGANHDETTLAPSDVAPATSPAPGRQFGHYQLVAEIGRGGMGVVYRADDPRLRRQVALKIIAPHRSSQPADRQRFRREAESAARLQHANIVQVFDFGEQDQTLYCALELVTGGSLAERLKQGPMPKAESAALVATLADAAEYAHRRQVVHRDLKPANILFADDGTPKIADFGLAKMLDEDSDQTQSGDLLGSPTYMAPEQARGEIAIVGPATDVHALGVILYEALAGHAPFRSATTMATLELVKHLEPPAPAASQHVIDRDLATICLKCLRKVPQQRYATAAELAADLRRFLAGVPVMARQPSWFERAWRAVRRNPVASALTAAIALMVMAASISFGFWLRQSTQFREASRRHTFAIQLQQAAIATRDVPQQARQLLDDAERCPPDLRDFTWHLLAARCDLKQVSWTNGAPLRALAVASKGELIATGDDQGTVRIWPAADQAAARVLRHHRQPITDLAFDSLGQQLAVASEDGDVSLWDSPKATAPTILATADSRATDVRANGVAFSPDGNLLATAHSDGVVRIWKPPQQQPLQEIHEHTGSVLRVAFNADGTLLASGSRDGSLRVWDTTNWQAQTSWSQPKSFITDLKFHPQRPRMLAFGTSQRTVYLWSLTGDNALELPTSGRGFDGHISSLAFTADGKTLAAGCYDKTVQLWNVPTRQPLVTYRDHPAEVFAVAFGRDEQLLVGAKDGSLVRWQVPADHTPPILASHRGGLTGLSYAGSGGPVISSGYDGSVCAWSRENGQKLAEHAQPATWATLLSCNGEHCAWEAGGHLWVGQFQSNNQLSARAVPGDPLLPTALALLPKSDALIVADATAVRGLNIRDGSLRWAQEEPGIHSFAVALTTPKLAMAAAGPRWWVGNGETGRGNWYPHGLTDVRCIAMSPAGDRVALGDADGNATVFTTVSGQPLFRLSGKAGAVQALVYSPDGLTLASGGDDGDVRFWDPLVGSLRGRLSTAGNIRWLAFAPDSRELACGNDAGEIRVWRTSSMDSKNASAANH